MIELFERARWHDLYNFFASGEPPMVTRILAINTIFLVLYIIRNARSKKKTSTSHSLVVQSFLILVNFVVMFQPQYLSMKPVTGGLF